MVVQEYFPILIIVVVAIGFGAILTLANILLGPKNRTEIKAKPFECGLISDTVAKDQRYNVKFYMTALAFLVFDVEVVFLYPLATSFRGMGFYAVIVGGIFLFMLVLGLVYEWKKGGLEWE